MNKKILSLLQYLFFLGLGVFLVVWSLRNIDANEYDKMKQSLRNANYWYLIPVVLALLASHFSRAMRWKILMEPLGYKTRIDNTYMAVLIGYLANLAIPRLGEILKCTILARYEKVPADKLVGTIVAERAFDMICLAIVMVITIFTQADLIGDFVYKLARENVGTGLSVTKIVIAVAVLLVLGGLMIYVFKKFAHVSFITKIRKIIAGVWQGLTSVRFVKHKGWFVFHTIFIWSMYLASVQIGMWALQETEGYGIKVALTVLFTGSIAMIVTPSGIGLYPILVMQTMALYGLGEAYGTAFGWVLWTVQFFQILIFGLIALMLLPYRNKKKLYAQA
jgi:glycosyltransferase 2 family protein